MMDQFREWAKDRHAYAQEWKADLVVMGCTSRGRIAKLVLGGTSEEVLINAEVPLFLSQ